MPPPLEWLDMENVMWWNHSTSLFLFGREMEGDPPWVINLRFGLLKFTSIIWMQWVLWILKLVYILDFSKVGSTMHLVVAPYYNEGWATSVQPFQKKRLFQKGPYCPSPCAVISMNAIQMYVWKKNKLVKILGVQSLVWWWDVQLWGTTIYI